MKLFYVGPNVHRSMPQAEIDARTRGAVGPIADLILGCLRPDGFKALVGLSAPNPGIMGPLRQPRPPYPMLGPRQELVGGYVVSRFECEAELRAVLVRMGDPFPVDLDEPPGGDIFRVSSMISCRSVQYGWDGQAFLCLHADDETPVSPDPALVMVEERQDLLTQADYADGVEAVEGW